MVFCFNKDFLTFMNKEEIDVARIQTYSFNEGDEFITNRVINTFLEKIKEKYFEAKEDSYSRIVAIEDSKEIQGRPFYIYINGDWVDEDCEFDEYFALDCYIKYDGFPILRISLIKDF